MKMLVYAAGAALLCVSAGLQAAEFRGTTASGAQYLFDVPPGWFPGSGLVIYNHGYDSNAPKPPTVPAALLRHVAAKNLAVLASSYAQRGWALHGTEQDHVEALARFKADFGDPGRVYAVGGSLGGLVAMQQAESTRLGVTLSGVYAVCAPLGGSKVWDQALDVRLSYDQICSGVSGGRLPSAPQVPFLLPNSAVDNNEDSETTLAEVALAASRCVGLGLEPALRSSGMQERRQRLLAATRMDDAFLEVNLYYATFGISDLYFDPAKLDQGMAFDNRDVDYGDAGLNAGILRVQSDPLARYRLQRNFTPTGVVGTQGVKILTTTTTGDGLVVPEHQSALLGKLDEFNWARAQVRESTGSHCGYSDAELLAGFDAMYDWARGQSIKPTAGQIQQRCDDLRLFGTPGACRYEANAVPASLETRIRSRPASLTPTLDGRYSGLWYDPARPGEGYVIELLSDQRALLAWYSYPPAGLPGEQRWIFGQGRVVDNGLVFDSAFQTTGGRFNVDYDGSVIRPEPFGSVRVVFDTCGHGFMEYTGLDPDFGDGRHEIVQLTHNGDQRCAGAAQPAPVAQSRYSGAWGGKPSEGLFINVQGDGRAFVTWYTYDLSSAQAWLFGEGRFEGDTLVIQDMLMPKGGVFGPDFSAPAVRFERWGSVQMSFTGCNSALVAYNAIFTGYGVGNRQFNRVTTPLGISCR